MPPVLAAIMDHSLHEVLAHTARANHQKVAEDWNRDKRWSTQVSLDVLDSKFDAQAEKAFRENARPELEEHKAHEIWKLNNPHKFKTEQFGAMGLGLFTNKQLKAEVVVLSETGISRKRDGMRLPAALLCTRAALSFQGDAADSYSPFPDYSLKQWNEARLMIATNAFTVGSTRVLYQFVSRINHVAATTRHYFLSPATRQ